MDRKFYWRGEFRLLSALSSAGQPAPSPRSTVVRVLWFRRFHFHLRWLFRNIWGMRSKKDPMACPENPWTADLLSKYMCVQWLFESPLHTRSSTRDFYRYTYAYFNVAHCRYDAELIYAIKLIKRANHSTRLISKVNNWVVMTLAINNTVSWASWKEDILSMVIDTFNSKRF